MVVTVAKFAEGAWVTVLLIPTIMIVMVAIRRHYRQVEAEVANPVPLDLSNLRAPLVVVPILSWNRIA
jgi:K+ transporter